MVERDAARMSEADVVYVITLEVKPGREEEFFALLTPVLDAMRHEASFVDCALHRDPEKPSRFLLYETWRSHEDVVNVQIHQPYRQAYHDALPELLARPREVGIWRPVRRDVAAGAA